MPHEAITVDGIEVVPLCDAVGPVDWPLEQTFSGGSPADWAGLDTAAWVLHFHCYLLRGKAGTVLVDTGVGGSDSPAADWAPTPGRLLDELAAAGAQPSDVDTVVITHLHGDHACGAVSGGAPAFPNARYVVQEAELAWAAPPIIDYVLRPLGDAVHAVDGAAELLPGISVHHTPGHTPGHQVVRVGEVTLTGDVVLHPVQLANPAVHYRHDVDAERAARTRIELLDEVRARNGLIATAHFAQPFTRL